MAKWDRKPVGAVFKGLKKDDGTEGPDTLIFSEDATFKKGDKLQIETKTYKEKNIGWMVKQGYMTEEKAEKAKYVVSTMSDKVRAEAVRVQKLTD